MALCINPPKTFAAKPFNPPNSPFICPPICGRSFTRKIFPSIKVSASSTIMSSHPPQVSTDGKRKNEMMSAIKDSLSNCLSETHLDLTIPSLQSKTRGKVRDIYDGGDCLVLVTTDRQSAFDRVLASIPFKGQVLNDISLWWFNRTQHIVPNAVICSPDENVTIAKKCSVFPVEFVVRGYVTGSTDTSLWTVYQKGIRNYCGNLLPNDMVKNQKLPANILTPTTKAADHDVPITPEEIIQQGLMTQADYDEASKAALSLFEYGQLVAFEHGLILVDTKYEFGKGSDGRVLLIDEVHTPDSSRYWIANSYEELFQSGLEPENIDKEFLRLWFKDHCNPYEDEVLPEAPEELVSELSWRYILLYETITQSKFRRPTTKIYGYRMSIWAEHVGFLEDCFTRPESVECVRRVRSMGEANWSQYASNEVSEMREHLLKYPVEVDRHGKVKPLLPGCETFPDVGGNIVGSFLAIQENLTI